MKKITIVLTLCLATLLHANPISPETARSIALNQLMKSGAKSDIQLVDVTALTPFKHLYIFNAYDGKGFVVVSADDKTGPVLAYSTENTFVTDMPAHIRAWFDGLERQIIFNSSSPYAIESSEPNNGDKANIPPMLTTQWNQSPYYNALCPYDNAAGKRSVSGCTAVATAQIMKYFNHPTQGYGSCTFIHKNFGPLSADYGNTIYLWDSMPEKLSANSTTGQVDAVSTIIYHCGVAVSMDYSANGSGGKTASYGYGGEAASENAYKYNFKYSPYIWTAFRCDYGDLAWKNMLRDEIIAGRPVLYAGYDEVQSGHAFVLDGYKSIDGTFHINWGWGGSADGWYTITNLNPKNTTYHFDLFATATIGIEPYELFGMASTTVTTSVEGIRGASPNDGTVTGAGTYNFGDTLTLTATATNEYTRFVQWSDGCRYNPRSTVATGGDLSFTAIFAPLKSDTIGFYTTGNAMNRASNVPAGLGTDSVWGIKIPVSALRRHHDLTAVRFMGRKQATTTLTILAAESEEETPPANAETLYSATFVDSLDYDYTWHTHTLPEPIVITPSDSKSLWIVLKCTEIDTPGVFSIWGGNNCGMLSGENLTPEEDWKFSWMIDGIFTWDGTESINDMTSFDFQVNPNPAKGAITLSMPEDNVNIDIFSIDGKKMKNINIQGTQQRTIDINDLPAGIYMLRASTNKAASIKKLIVR
ncbi:MAG: thiol protease/hemagglutinin PrtT [Bacteroidales bacterium]|nr:thiol protease/hemagglutinin PrtT [Bacteroidales bacterium]